MHHEITSDIPDDFESKYLEICKEYGWEPIPVLSCWNSESGIKASSQNPNGYASGIFQIMPDTAHGLGWMPGDARWNLVHAARKVGDWKTVVKLHKELMSGFIQLNASEQLDWAVKYYGPKGMMQTGAECYVRTFLPAEKEHANNPDYVLCGIHGPYKDAYIGNHQVFDTEGKGFITVQDLTDRINLVWQGGRVEEIKERIYEAQGLPVPPYQFFNTDTLAGCQEALDKLEFETFSLHSNGRGDGIWGPKSRTACDRFQNFVNLTSTGNADSATREALKATLEG